MMPSMCDVCEGLIRVQAAPAAQEPGSLYTMAGLGGVEGIETSM
jgi:hypothetical protein